MKLLNTDQAADVLGVSRRRVNQFVRDGRLSPAAPTRAAHVFRERDVLRFRDLRAAGLGDGRQLPPRIRPTAAPTGAGA
jgi:hypothetical protein